MPLVAVEEGVELYYEVTGHPTAQHKVLCIMGWATCNKMGSWENQIEYFSQFPEFEVCIFDNRGSGLSSSPPGNYTMQMLAQDGLRIADHLGWEKFHLMGASMGGMVSQRIAIMAPQRIRSLTLLCTRFNSGWWHSWPTWTAMGIIVKQHFETFVWKDQSAHVRNLLNLLFSPKYLADNHHTGITNREHLLQKISERKKMIPPMNMKGSMSQLAAINGHHITNKDIDILVESKFTTLIITGDSDLMVPHKHSLHIKSQLQHKAELVVIEGAGHGVLEESKHFINTKVRDFILNAVA